MDQKEILKHVDHTQLRHLPLGKTFRNYVRKRSNTRQLLYVSRHATSSGCMIRMERRSIFVQQWDFHWGTALQRQRRRKTKKALEDGASEVDMVVNISDVKNGNYDAVQAEIAALKKITGDKILKVIIETCYLTEEEKIAMCKADDSGGSRLHQDFHRIWNSRSNTGRHPFIQREYRTGRKNESSGRSQDSG